MPSPSYFPSPLTATEEGLVAWGGQLETLLLVDAYRHGIFPWPMADGSVVWFSPDPRAVLDFSKLHIPRSLYRAQRQSRLEFSVNRAFPSVIEACSRVPRPNQEGTWITEDLKRAYIELHRLGISHSVEAWEDGQLVGGVYGVEVDGVFAGESMFHLRPNASKLALLYLFSYLEAQGAEWMDIQMITPHMRALGATEISRKAFLLRLHHTQQRGLRLF